MMALMPRNPREIWKRLKSFTQADKDAIQQDEVETVKPLRENQYFTFNKDGKLIDLDDEAASAVEQRIHEDWRRAYIESVEEQDDNEC